MGDNLLKFTTFFFSYKQSRVIQLLTSPTMSMILSRGVILCSLTLAVNGSAGWPIHERFTASLAKLGEGFARHPSQTWLIPIILEYRWLAKQLSEGRAPSGAGAAAAPGPLEPGSPKWEE